MTDWLTSSTLRGLGLGNVILALYSGDPDVMQSVEADALNVVKAVGVLCSLIERIEREAPGLLRDEDDVKLLLCLARDVTGVCSDALEAAHIALNKSARMGEGEDER